MTTYLAVAFGGLGLGAMYALQALGLVIVFKTSRVFNFAAGGMGMVAAYVASVVQQSAHLGWVLAVVAGVLAGAAVGVAMAVSLRPVASPLNRTVVTLGWLLALQGLMGAVFGQAAGRTPARVVSSKPLIGFDHHSTGDVFQLGTDEVLVIAVVAALALVLAVFFRRSRLGVSMRAVADDPEAARLLGLDVSAVTLLSWALGGAISGLAGILVTPLLGSLDTLTLILFTIQALAAALVGRLSSLPLTLLGGVLLGVAQPMVALALQGTGVQGSDQLVALAVILAALALRRRTGRGDQSAAGLIPVAVAPLPSRPVSVGLGAGSVLAAVLLVELVTGSAHTDDVITFAGWSLAILSLVLLTGIVGQVSLCQGLFMGVGAYVAAIGHAHGLPFFAALLLGAAVAGAVAMLVGLPALRLAPLELAIVTLALAFTGDQFLYLWQPLVSTSTTRPLPRPAYAAPAPGHAFPGDRAFAFTALGILAAAMLMVAALRRGRTGAALTALRSSEAATAAMGFSVTWAKLRGFALAGALAGVGGVVFAASSQTVDGKTFPTLVSISLLAYAVIGGVGSVPGALVGGLIVALSTASFGSGSAVASDRQAAVTTLLTGAVLIAVLLLAPEGITGLGTRLARRWRRPPDVGEPVVPVVRRDEVLA